MHCNALLTSDHITEIKFSELSQSETREITIGPYDKIIVKVIDPKTGIQSVTKIAPIGIRREETEKGDTKYVSDFSVRQE